MMLVEEVMTTGVVSVPVDSTLREAVAAMLSEHVGSVVVDEDGNPTGILTEADVLVAGYRAEESFDDIAVVDAMRTPLATINPDATIRRAAERMREEEVEKLAVVDGIDVVGVLT